METVEEHVVSSPELDSGEPQEHVVSRDALGVEYCSELVGNSSAAEPVFSNNSAKVVPLGSMAQSIQRVGLSSVQKDRGMTMTSNGQLVKLSDTEQITWRRFWKQNWNHKAAILWSKLTSVEDPFTGHVFESRFGEAVHPSAPLYRCWNTFHKILMLYPTMVAPLTVAFHAKAEGMHVLGRLVEVALMSDTLVTFFVAIKDGKTSDHLERHPLLVADHYIKSWLLFDVVTSTPWQLFLPFLLNNTSLAWVTETVTVREALSFVQIARYLTIIRRDSYNIVRLQSIQYKQRALLSFVLFVLVASHWMSCLWMLMARTYLEWFALTDENAIEKTWLWPAGVDLENNSLQSQYIQVRFFSPGDRTGNWRFRPLKAIMDASEQEIDRDSLLVEMVASWQTAEQRFKAHQDDLIEYMRARTLPDGVQKRILKFYDFQRQHAAVFYNESEILDKLTPNLRAEVTHFAHKDTVKLLKGLKLFDALEESLLTRLIVALTTEFMPPDELVVAEGELGDVLYIIRKGVVSVIKGGVQQALLTDGQSFGETVLYATETKRTATVVTRSYCQLMLLSKKAVKAALATRPQEYEALQAKARVLYQAHLSRSSRWERPDILNDSTFALLRTSLSLSRDIQIEGNQPSSSQTDGPGPVDSSGGHDRFSGIDNCLPLLARPTHDRPRTFD